MSHAPTPVGIFAVFLLSGTALLSGCAAPAPVLPSPVEYRIGAPLSAEDHEAIALEHEGRAAADAAKAKRHTGFAEVYRRNRAAKGAAEAHEPLAKHCDGVAQTYRQAAEQKLGKARLHRELARQAVRD